MSASSSPSSAAAAASTSTPAASQGYWFFDLVIRDASRCAAFHDDMRNRMEIKDGKMFQQVHSYGYRSRALPEGLHGAFTQVRGFIKYVQVRTLKAVSAELLHFFDFSSGSVRACTHEEVQAATETRDVFPWSSHASLHKSRTPAKTVLHLDSHPFEFSAKKSRYLVCLFNAQLPSVRELCAALPVDARPAEVHACEYRDGHLLLLLDFNDATPKSTAVVPRHHNLCVRTACVYATDEEAARVHAFVQSFERRKSFELRILKKTGNRVLADSELRPAGSVALAANQVVWYKASAEWPWWPARVLECHPNGSCTVDALGWGVSKRGITKNTLVVCYDCDHQGLLWSELQLYLYEHPGEAIFAEVRALAEKATAAPASPPAVPKTPEQPMADSGSQPESFEHIVPDDPCITDNAGDQEDAPLPKSAPPSPERQAAKRPFEETEETFDSATDSPPPAPRVFQIVKMVRNFTPNGTSYITFTGSSSPTDTPEKPLKLVVVDAWNEVAVEDASEDLEAIHAARQRYLDGGARSALVVA